MDNLSKVYSLNPPGLMRPDSDEDTSTNTRPMPVCRGVDDMPLAMAYIPMQTWRDIYENDKAIMRGTIFGELDLPFKGANSRR